MQQAEQVRRKSRLLRLRRGEISSGGFAAHKTKNRLQLRNARTVAKMMGSRLVLALPVRLDIHSITDWACFLQYYLYNRHGIKSVVLYNTYCYVEAPVRLDIHSITDWACFLQY